MKHVPNILSTFRIILVPLFALVFFSDMANAHTLAVGVFVLAGLTDVLDGWIARKYNCISLLGRVLDPLADKLMVMTALVCMSVSGIIPYFVSILYVGKECFQIIGSAVVLKFIKDMPPSNKLGKSATLLIYVAIVATILFDLPEKVSYCLFAAAYAAVFSALVSYIISGVTLLKENRK